MRMLQWMIGYTRKYRIQNTIVREKTGIALVIKKTVDYQVRWSGHVMRRPTNAPVERVD